MKTSKSTSRSPASYLALPYRGSTNTVTSLAVSHVLETTNVSGSVDLHVQRMSGGPTSGQQSNPYHLPWIMRGLLEEDFVKTELHHETAELVRQFDEWKPVTKALKDVKYRLEAVRSKL